MSAEGFRDHVTTDCSLLRVPYRWGACGWSDEVMGRMRGMYGTLIAELEVQRTIKRAELRAFSCLFRKVIAPARVHVDNKGIIDGLWKREMKCIGPEENDAD